MNKDIITLMAVVVFILIGASSIVAWNVGYAQSTHTIQKEAVKVGVAHFSADMEGKTFFEWHTNKVLELK